MLLTRLLEQHDYFVLTASSVRQADKVLAQEAIDAVVLDVRMPTQSGLVLLEAIRRQERWRNMPVLISTGVVLTQEEQDLVARHRAYVFYKPTSYDTLIVYLDKLTRSNL